MHHSKVFFSDCSVTVGLNTGQGSAVGNVSGCKSRGHEFDPGLVPYFHGDINHEIISTVIFPHSAGSRRVVVSYKPTYVHEILVNTG